MKNRDENIYYYILRYVLTRSHAERMTKSLSMVISSFYQPDLVPMDVMQKELSSFFPKDFVEELVRFSFSSALPDENRNHLSQIITFLSSCKLAFVTLSFYPSDQFTFRVVQAVRELFGKEVILDVQVDSGIRAGMIMIFEGNYYDYSLSKLVGQSIAHKKDKLQTLFR